MTIDDAVKKIEEGIGSEEEYWVIWEFTQHRFSVTPHGKQKIREILEKLLSSPGPTKKHPFNRIWDSKR